MRIAGLLARGALFATLIPGTLFGLSNSDGGAAPFFVSYAVVGAVLVAKQPRNLIGLIVLALGWNYLASSYSFTPPATEVIAGTADLPTEILAWINSSASGFVLTLFLALTILFPDGHLPKGRGGVLGGFALALSVALVLFSAFLPDLAISVQGSAEVLAVNPFALLHGGFWEGIGASPAASVVMALLVAGVVAMLLRFRRARGIERLRLRWLVTSLVVITLTAIVAVSLALAGVDFEPAWIALALAFPLLPISVAVAVLRYRLYDLDLIINRSIVYLLLTGLLAGLYAATVALFQKIFVGITGSTDGAVILSTLLLVSVFSPARKWLESIVDRRFKPTGQPAPAAPQPSTPPAQAADWEERMALIARRVFEEERAARG